MLSQGEQAVGISPMSQTPLTEEEVAAQQREQDNRDAEAAVQLLRRMAAAGRLPPGVQLEDTALSPAGGTPTQGAREGQEPQPGIDAHDQGPL